MTLGSPLIPPSGIADTLAAGAAKADNGAARRTARRTARRVSRRQARYYNALPSGCVKVFVPGVSYFQCGTVYYQPVVHQGADVCVRHTLTEKQTASERNSFRCRSLVADGSYRTGIVGDRSVAVVNHAKADRRRRASALSAIARATRSCPPKTGNMNGSKVRDGANVHLFQIEAWGFWASFVKPR